MSYQDRYQEWLHSPALSAAEKAELESIQNDPKEIESRFFDQLSFGTAGLRGTMGVGLYRMNVHVIRHATQAFAQVLSLIHILFEMASRTSSLNTLGTAIC